MTDPVRWWARVTPDHVALVDRARGARLSYAALDDLAGRWAALLIATGAQCGDRVAALSPNRHELVALYLACGRIGAALVPLNWRLAPPELARVFADARVTLIVGEARFRGAHEAGDAALRAVPWLDIDDGAARARTMDPWHDDAATFANAPRSLDAPAMVLYTSGSTGRPKGAIITHRQVLFNAIATTTGWGLGAGDVGPITTPFFHTGGWHVFATPLWFVGGTAVLVDPFDPATFLDVLRDEGCTIAFAVPTQFVMLADQPNWGQPLPRLRWFISGGAPCAASLAVRIRGAGYALREGFGMTEFGPNCFATSDAQALAKPGSVGWPVPFVEMRLVDAAGRDVPAGVSGELWLRGPQRFAGYLFDDANTGAAITPDGWLRTGDLASRDADGAFTIRGRKKDMFISGGENVYPGEVEAAIGECVGVADAVVIGVPDARWGEVGHAFVHPRPGATLDAATLLAELRVRIAAYKVPKAIVILPELPRIGSGKVDRRALAQLATARG